MLTLLGVVGCGPNPTVPIPPTAGDFVENNNGVGTARVFGIDFDIQANASGTSTDDTVRADFLDVEKSHATKRFTLGNDITIQLDRIDDSHARFQFNDQDFGTLHVGDKVVVDDKRAVQVNGELREANVPK